MNERNLIHYGRGWLDKLSPARFLRFFASGKQFVFQIAIILQSLLSSTWAAESAVIHGSGLVGPYVLEPANALSSLSCVGLRENQLPIFYQLLDGKRANEDFNAILFANGHRFSARKLTSTMGSAATFEIPECGQFRFGEKSRWISKEIVEHNVDISIGDGQALRIGEQFEFVNPYFQDQCEPLRYYLAACRT